jgi:hypothetical protein
VELPASREGEPPPVPGVVVVRLPLGFYDEPPPSGQAIIKGQHVADWLGPFLDPIDVELAKRNAHDAVSWWGKLLDELPPIFPLG